MQKSKYVILHITFKLDWFKNDWRVQNIDREYIRRDIISRVSRHNVIY